MVSAQYDYISEEAYIVFDANVPAGAWPAGWFHFLATPPQDHTGDALAFPGGIGATLQVYGEGGISGGSQRLVYTGPTGGITSVDGRQLVSGSEWPAEAI